jgi:Skp family chaperone for outer membrane proteins
MRITRLALTVAMLAVVNAIPSNAQTPAKPAAPGGQPQAGSLPDAKIAIIDTEAFADEKQGITKLVSALKEVQKEFAPRSTDLQQMQVKIKALADDISKTKDVADPTATRSKQEQGEALQREYKYKADEAQAAYDRRLKERAGPIYDDLSKALDAFAKQRGIVLLLDVSKLGGAVLTADPNMDVTRAFITDYNSRNPTTASR